MNFFRRLNFRLWYLGQPPWDSGIVPPEVEEFIRSHSPGRALDLGCGTGTSSLALARAGWKVVGVDFIPRAIKKAKQKAKTSRVEVDFRVGEATHLSSISGPFDLVLDIGCFHGLAPTDKRAYIDQLDRLLAPGGTWLMYAFFRNDKGSGPALSQTDLDLALRHLRLVQRRDGMERGLRPSSWFWFRK
jgi:2-polyprenyl-3-methyl-5-hydroxy-6-metoxy-1,4-benzoquinol methylase